MSKRVFWLGVMLVALALAFTLTHHILGPPPGVTAANVRRLREGMRRQEVEAILGKPGTVVDDPGFPPLMIWSGKEGVVIMTFDYSLRASQIHFVSAQSSNPNSLARLRSWLGW